MELNNVVKMAAVLGNGLNKEEESGLEVAMLLRKLQEKLDNGPMLFWGKINGATQDYYIVVYVDRFAEFPDKKFYFRYQKRFFFLDRNFICLLQYIFGLDSQSLSNKQ
jgi:hypothetical protein